LFAIGAALALRPIAALVALLVLPVCAWAGLRLVELFGDFIERARGAWMLATRRDLGTYVQSERAAIRAEVMALAERLEPAS
jgi:hypothetical protein